MDSFRKLAQTSIIKLIEQYNYAIIVATKTCLNISLAINKN